ncbi:MAG: hypothetical protein H6657_26575 [Ardenticatenaceae bacterium]|nr:hypothetical protein [Ardenticatenaceae bacterium]
MAKPPKWQSWLIVFGLASLGFLAGVQYNRLSTTGYFVRWEKLGTPPSNTGVELSDISWSSVYIEYSENFYFCGNSESNCQPVEDLFNCNTGEIDCLLSTDNLSKNIANCDYESIAFSSRVKPPKNIESCIYEFVSAADGEADSFAVIDNEGSVWLWQNPILLFLRPIALAIMPAFGILAGLALGLSFNLYQRYLRPFLKRPIGLS